MTDSILISTKAALGISEEQTSFDTEVVLYINTALSRLTQIGAGPEEGFRVVDASATWADLIGPSTKLDMIKGYVVVRVKMLFDPPEIGFVLTALKEFVKEEEWRIMVETDPDPIDPNEPVILGR